MRDGYGEAYREEAYELLGALEQSLLELEKAPADKEIIGSVFRAMHTIKGSGAMYGFEQIASFTHDIETVYDLVRSGKTIVTKELVDLTLIACDQIKEMVGAPDGAPSDAVQAKQIVEAFRAFIGNTQRAEEPDKAKDSGDSEKTVAQAEAIAVPDEEKTAIYRIRFRPVSEIFLSGTNPISLLRELSDLGHCKIIAHTEDIPFLPDINPEACYSSWDIILRTNKGINAIRDVFIFVENDCMLTIDLIDRDDFVENDVEYKRLGDILIDRGDITPEQITEAINKQKPLGEILVDAGVIAPDKVESALAEQAVIREARKERQAKDTAGSIRVPADRLDALVNMVGELVTVQSRLSQAVVSLENLEFSQIAEEVERLTAELRDNTMSIRMMPIGSTFSKFNRLVRDLSRELGKEIVLSTDGAETELDKTVIEKLNDPMVHLIRNAIDHGIESPAERAKLGKPRQGNILLSAIHSGAFVLIQIIDDGAGLDKDAIFRKAVERGLIMSDAVLSEKEIFSFLFAPGFSTAKVVTNVSGRGVGMDVVKKNIDALQGSVEMSSKKGEGTTVTLKIPLTLAIIDGLLTRISDTFFVIPLSAIEECIELTREEAEKSHGQNFINIRGEIVPYIHLRDRFGIVGKRPRIEQIAITRHENHRIGLVIDEVIGEHQTVIKKLGRFYRHVEEVSGATILGNGTVALILDLPRLISKTQLEEKNALCERLIN